MELHLTEKQFIIVEIAIPRSGNSGCTEEFACTEIIAFRCFFCCYLDCFAHTHHLPLFNGLKVEIIGCFPRRAVVAGATLAVRKANKTAVPQ